MSLFRQRFPMLLVLSIASVRPCPVDAQEHGPDPREDTQALRSLASRALQALDENDTGKLLACLADPFVIVPPNQSTIRSPEGIVVYADELLHNDSLPVVSISTTVLEQDLTVTFPTRDTAVCTSPGTMACVLRTRDLLNVPITFSGSAVRLELGWRFSIIHVGVDYLENPFLATRTGLWRRLAALAFLVGVLAGVAGFTYWYHVRALHGPHVGGVSESKPDAASDAHQGSRTEPT